MTRICLAVALCTIATYVNAADSIGGVEHVVIFAEDGKFAGWPANHGMWSWGNEILVGFSLGTHKDRGPYHNIDKEKPEEFKLARSLDGGLSWKVEEPQPRAVLVGSLGMRHGILPPDLPLEQPQELKEPIDFLHPDLALTVRMENTNTGTSRLTYSYDRGKTWKGPFLLPLFGQKGVMGRTDLIVNGKHDAFLMLTASKANGKEGRPFIARTTDGGLTWTFESFIGEEPSGFSIMPSSVRISETELVTTVRRQDEPKAWIDAYVSKDNGKTWAFLSKPEPDTGEGNPPSLLKLADGRLALIYGVRGRPLGIRARLSDDNGKTWSGPINLRDDGGSRDLGYVRSVIRPDGKIVAAYYYTDKKSPYRYLAATLWTPPAKGEAYPTVKEDVWTPLFNGKDLKGWYTFLQKHGKNSDPDRVITIEDNAIHLYKHAEDKSNVVMVYIGTEKEYSDYHLRFDYKWGDKKLEPRYKLKPDAGLYYHILGEDKVWPRALQYQVEQSNVADLITLYGFELDSSVDPKTYGEEMPTFLPLERGGKERVLGGKGIAYQKHLAKNFERDDWNHAEIIVRGDTTVHLLNSHVMNQGKNIRLVDPANPTKPLTITKGRIALEIEAAEIWFKNVEIRSLSDTPITAP